MTETKTKSKILELFDEGVRLSVDEHAVQEQQKVGILRAGNTGIAALNAKGEMEVGGKCHRQTMLRLLGIASEDADYLCLTQDEATKTSGIRYSLGHTRTVSYFVRKKSLSNG